ncbi:putative phosphotransferase [Corynebacterium efficiens YS-314]|uniref:Putative phosphotransferase n=1 Tax=Corynebacterium efficiens (strain DSM 44549 / YS-314 / AJ 12310 / JCM 11189 / NBRC 100395) TaxID=196164 RepID=Q8FQL6_COREF|nr:putative phosphotransferase [Corynebacterium efficiens YS-314]
MVVVDILALARAHRLDLDPESLRFIEMGLDFRVVMATDTVGRGWVLRIPRYPSVMDRAAAEARVLQVVSRHLPVQVPDWRIHTRELIAYPLLPGVPGLELAGDGEPVWNVDASSPVYVDDLAGILTQLHAIPAAEVADTGIPIRTPEEVRETWSADIDRVAQEFTVNTALLRRWREWVEEDSYWPEHTVLTHGELYPGHTLVEDGRITGIIDWTTARVGDPAADLMMQQMIGTPDSVERLLDRYVRGGGQIWPRIREHCAELIAASPVGYALYALEVDNPELLDAAAMMLNPADP